MCEEETLRGVLLIVGRVFSDLGSASFPKAGVVSYLCLMLTSKAEWSLPLSIFFMFL